MYKILRIFIFGLLLIVLEGCGPDIGPLPKINQPSNYLTQKSFRAKTIAWPSDEWWKHYQDPQLNHLIAESLQNSPTLKSVEARIHQALAITQQGASLRYPQISLKGNGFRSYAKNEIHSFVDIEPETWSSSALGMLSFSYEFDFWKKNKNTFLAAYNEAEAVKADAAQAKMILITSLVDAYADLVQLHADLEASLKTVQIRKKTLELFKERSKNGLENDATLSQVDSLQQTAFAKVESLKEAIDLARNRIATLVGKGPDVYLTLTSPKINLKRSFGLPQDLRLNLVGRRPDIIAAKLRAEAAASKIQVAHAAYYPNINLMSNFTHLAVHNKDIFNPSTILLGIGPAVSLPIFNAKRIEGGYRKARAEYDASVFQYNQTLQHAFGEITDVSIRARSLLKRLEKTQKALKSAERAHKIIKGRYQGDLATYLDVLKAEDTLIDANLAVVDLKARALKLDVALVKALGGGFNQSSFLIK
jgi:NodT family efflux transporter outer membrane factor (OMF) lipoprotein